MKVALIQLNSGDDVDSNFKTIKKMLLSIKDPASLDLISLPENALHFRTNRKEIFEGIDLKDWLFDFFHEYAKQYDLAIAWGGVALKESGSVSNAFIVQTPEERATVVYRKIHLFDVSLPSGLSIKESEQFKAGDKPCVWEWKSWKFGVSICYDLRFPELYLSYARQGVDALLIPSAFTQTTGKAHWHCLLRARAIESQAYVLAAAQAGTHGEKLKTYGHSLIVGPWGEVLAEQEENTGVILCELDQQKSKTVREQIPISQHRKIT